MRVPAWFLYVPAISLFFAVTTGDLHPVYLVEGAIVGLLTLPLVWRLFDLSRAVDLFALLRAVVQFVWAFFTLFIPQALISSLDMARRVLSPTIPMAPGIVAIPLRFEGPLDALFLQNHVTLTPGAMVVEYDEDRGILYLHTIDARDPEKVIREVQTTHRKGRGR